MSMKPQMTAAEEKADAKVRGERMARYDLHMNRHGHYSVMSVRAHAPSPILEEIKRKSESNL